MALVDFLIYFEDWHLYKIFRSLLNVFGDCLSTFRDCMPGELSREDKLDGRLNFSRRKSSSLVESDELGSLSGNSVKGIMNEGVHNVHGLLGNPNVRVHLLEHFVYIDGEGLDSSSSGLPIDFFGFDFSWFLASHFSN